MGAIDGSTASADAPQTILQDLLPRRCATIAEPRPTTGPDSSSEFLFTAKEVAWYIYPETGLYTIISGIVYDMTSTLEFDLVTLALMK